ncbi:hypothetical protein EV284_3398 [Streptomyces sp. BK022]|uniref:hypothetical protein n=1 Tax=Streptomyces sp. BK022 TaxID=2512123 RepID=UPI00102A5390|nr:hypothetical protein [Streptomyces sp. BK022]RZU35915.1 hypothetical protein EV284_3398 [Streptomyces sp. BK022]
MDRFGMENIVHQVGETMNPQSGVDPTMSAQQHQLMREQHDFYMQQQSMGGQSFQGFGGLRGLKDAAWGVVILLGLGLFFKYIVGVG